MEQLRGWLEGENMFASSFFIRLWEHESHTLELSCAPFCAQALRGGLAWLVQEFSRINRTLVYFFFYWVGKHLARCWQGLSKVFASLSKVFGLAICLPMGVLHVL